MPSSRDYYDKLASEVQQERIQAATSLLSELSKENSKKEWDYALSHLIKGLTTSQKSARFGFSMALTEVVRELVTKQDYDLSIPSFLKKITTASTAAPSQKGKEDRSALFGRLFGFQALVNSGLLFEKDHSSSDILQNFVKSIAELAGEKVWLRETAMYTLCQLLAAYLQSPFADDKTTVAFLQLISDNKLMFTTEGLAFVLTIPQVDRGRICSEVTSTEQWKHGDPMARGNLPALSKVLKEAEVESDEAEEKNSFGRPVKKTGKQKDLGTLRIPFVWDLLAKHFSDDTDSSDEVVEEKESSKKRKKSSSGKKKKAKVESATELIPFKEFWKVTVDDTLFGETAPAERKAWGFEIFSRFLVNLSSSMVEHIFTPNLMRCLINQSAQANRSLHKVATKTIRKVIEVAQTDLNKTVPCIQAVISEERGGGWKFDQLSKSKLCEGLVCILNSVDKPEELLEKTAKNLVQGITDSLFSKFNAALESQKEVEAHDEASKKSSNDLILKWVLDKIQAFVKSTKKCNRPFTSTLEDVFKFLVRHAFFASKTGPNVSPNTIKLVQERVNTILSEFISERRKDHSWSLYCVKQIEKLESRDEFELVMKLSDELVVVKEECVGQLDAIKKAMKRDAATKNDQYCFELLFSLNLIQLYTGEAETVGVLEDLKTSYTEIFGRAAEGIDTSVVLTEILLSFVSRKSRLLKNLSNLVWENFMCAENAEGRLNVTDKCFELLFNVLASKENEEGQKKLFEGEDEFGDGSASENESEKESGNDSDSEIEEESNTTDGKTSVEMVEQETTKKLANALGIKDDYDGEVKFDDLDSDNDDQYESESMDDEQMMAIDDELAKIFKERRSALTENSTTKKKSDQTAAKEQMLLFKNRVLDLMDAFCKVQQNSVYILSFLQPLVSLINTTKNKDLGVKAHKLLKVRVGKFKCSDSEVRKVYLTDSDVDAFKTSLLESISSIQSQAGKRSTSQSHGTACAQSCIILSKCLIAIDPSTLPEIIQIYCTTLTAWASEPKNKIQAGMFFDFINWLNTKRSSKA